jgi:hypothetical protein
MRLFGMPLDPVTKMPPKKDRVHIDQVWDRYETYRAGIGVAGYTLPQPNPFDNWNISNRYAHASGFSRTYVEQHKSGAETVKALIDKAVLEGRL